MKTYKLYTLCGQIVTVRNCKNKSQAMAKADLKPRDVFKSEEL